MPIAPPASKKSGSSRSSVPGVAAVDEEPEVQEHALGALKPTARGEAEPRVFVARRTSDPVSARLLPPSGLFHSWHLPAR
jgi:hypothetical protein